MPYNIQVFVNSEANLSKGMNNEVEEFFAKRANKNGHCEIVRNMFRQTFMHVANYSSISKT